MPYEAPPLFCACRMSLLFLPGIYLKKRDSVLVLREKCWGKIVLVECVFFCGLLIDLPENRIIIVVYYGFLQYANFAVVCFKMGLESNQKLYGPIFSRLIY